MKEQQNNSPTTEGKFLGESSMESAEGGFSMAPPALQMKTADAPVQMLPGNDTTPTREENLTTTSSLTTNNAGTDGMVHITPEYQRYVTDFETAITGITDVAALELLAVNHGRTLWDFACTEIRDATQTGDDRPMYVARLQMTALLRAHTALAGNNADLLRVLDAFESNSRGQTSSQINFAVPAGREDEAEGLTLRKVLISGFDPFFSSSQILPVSNPSGAAAMQLDGTMVTAGGSAALIEAVTFPVRYADFDEGMVETVFRPYLTGDNAVDMVITLSLDPSSDHDFNIEGYATRNRGGHPDNNDVDRHTSGYQDGPQTHGADAPEFVSTTLPWHQILLGTQDDTNDPYDVRLRKTYTMAGVDQAALDSARQTRSFINASERLGISIQDLLGMLMRFFQDLTTDDDRQHLTELTQLAAQIRGQLDSNHTERVDANSEESDYFTSEGLPTDQTMDRASGGSYLSNEIMYRVGHLAGDLGSTVPYGHIHVPNNFDTNGNFQLDRNVEIKAKIDEIIQAALPAIGS